MGILFHMDPLTAVWPVLTITRAILALIPTLLRLDNHKTYASPPK